MASTGLLNVDISALNLQTHSRYMDGQWSSQTSVVRMPPLYCQEVKLPPTVCSSVMQALVVFSAIENDPNGELAEMREMAAMVEADWPDLTTTSIGRALEAGLRVAWESHAPGSPSTAANRLTRALSEKLHGAALAAGGGETTGTAHALEYARATLRVVSS